MVMKKRRHSDMPMCRYFIALPLLCCEKGRGEYSAHPDFSCSRPRGVELLAYPLADDHLSWGVGLALGCREIAQIGAQNIPTVVYRSDDNWGRLRACPRVQLAFSKDGDCPMVA